MDAAKNDVVTRLRREITPDQRALLDRIWTAWRADHKGLPRRVFADTPGGMREAHACLAGLGGSVVRLSGESNSEPRSYSISLLGALLTSEGDMLEQTLADFLLFACRNVMASASSTTITSDNLLTSGEFDAEAVDNIHHMFALHWTLSWGGGGSTGNSWSRTVPNWIDELLEVSDMAAEVRRRAAADYDPGSPIDPDAARTFARSTNGADAGSFTFIRDDQLRRHLSNDWGEAKRAFDAGCWKSVVLLCGAVMEGVLHDALAPTGTCFDQWERTKRKRLLDLVREAEQRGVVRGGLARMIDGLREFRNLVHPARQLELDAPVGMHEAQIAVNCTELLLKARTKQAASSESGAAARRDDEGS